VGLVRVIFNPAKAEVICGLPLSFLHQSNTLIWHGTKKGCFTIRSAYFLELSRRAREEGECSRPQEVLEVWKTI
jgi:ribonuclease HI